MIKCWWRSVSPSGCTDCFTDSSLFGDRESESRHSLWSPHGIGQTIIFLRCGFFLSFYLFYSSPNLSRRRLDACPYFHTWCGLSANLRCRSEMCCTRLAENTERKKMAKNRHMGTIAQICRAISSQLRHVSTIGKKIY